MSDLTPVEQAAADAIRGFEWSDYGLDGVGIAIRNDPDYQQWIPDLAREVVAQAVGAPGERIEWGVRWHGGDVLHGRSGDGGEVYDEGSARATAARYVNAEAVFRRAAGPWIGAAGEVAS